MGSRFKFVFLVTLAKRAIYIYRKRRHTNVAMGNSPSPVVPEMPHFNLNQINYMI